MLFRSQVKFLQLKFDFFDLLHVPRSGNAYADSLAMLATSSTEHLPRVILVEDLYKPIETREVAQIHQIRVRPSWMDSIIRFLKEDILPEEKIEADKESSLGKIMAKLGRTLSYHLQSWHWRIFFRRSGRTCSTTSLECKQPEEVLLLTSIYSINLCVLYIKCLYCLSFGFL